MLDTLARNIIYGKTYCAFEHIGNKEQANIRLLVARYVKSEIDIAYTTEVTAINQIKNQNHIPKHSRLIINNEQVLSKKVEQSNTLSDTVLLNEAFPSIDAQDFYYEIVRLSNKAFVWICRKSYLQDLLAQYEEGGIHITGWRLGVSAMKNFEGLINDGTHFTAGSFSFAYAKGTLTDIAPSLEENTTSNYRIQDLEVEGTFLNTLGIILENFGVDRLYALGLPLAIGTLLVIFLVNFFVFNHYFTKVDQLEAIGNSNSVQRQLLLKKDSIVDQKQRLFEDVIASSSSSSSYYIDEIVSTMPNSILLNNLSYHPLLKKIKKNKPLSMETNTIEIKGSTSVNRDLSNWISELEKVVFIEEVSIKNLDKNGRQTEFNLTITLGS